MEVSRNGINLDLFSAFLRKKGINSDPVCDFALTCWNHGIHLACWGHWTGTSVMVSGKNKILPVTFALVLLMSEKPIASLKENFWLNVAEYRLLWHGGLNRNLELSRFVGRAGPGVSQTCSEACVNPSRNRYSCIVRLRQSGTSTTNRLNSRFGLCLTSNKWGLKECMLPVLVRHCSVSLASDGLPRRASLKQEKDQNSSLAWPESSHWRHRITSGYVNMICSP